MLIAALFPVSAHIFRLRHFFTPWQFEQTNKQSLIRELALICRERRVRFEVSSKKLQKLSLSIDVSSAHPISLNRISDQWMCLREWLRRGKRGILQIFRSTTTGISIFKSETCHSEWTNEELLRVMFLLTACSLAMPLGGISVKNDENKTPRK